MAESFSILRFSEATFQNLSIFLAVFNLNDVTRRFCDVTISTYVFYDSF